MSAAGFDGVAGNPSVNPILATLVTTPAFQQGTPMPYWDTWWGGGEFIYGKASGAIRQKGLCMFQRAFTAGIGWECIVLEVTNTANMGRGLCVAAQAMANGQYGWFQIAGVTPINCSATLAAEAALGITAAGQAGANTAGKQILNAVVRAAGATTVAKVGCQGYTGSFQLDIPNAEGWFPGVYVAGTNVGAAAIVTAIAPDGRSVTVSVANSGMVNGTVTATYNNATIFYNVVDINRPFAQGAIT